MSTLEDIREAHRLYDIRAVLGLSSRRDWIVCPFPDHPHRNNSPSFSIYQAADGVQRFKCHGACGRMGDVIDLVGYLHIPGYDPKDMEMVRRALGQLDQKFEIAPVVLARKKALHPNRYREYLPPGEEVLAYMQTRGLSPQTLTRYRIGQFKHFCAMPVFEAGELKGIKFRNTWPLELLDGSDLDHLRFWSASGSVKAVFNYDAVAYTDRPVLVLKAEIPVMLADQYGFLACAPTGGEGSYVEGLYNLLVFSPRRVVVGDNDLDPGVREKMQAAARERALVLRAELKFPPEHYKDIDAWLLAEPAAALPAIRQWLGG